MLGGELLESSSLAAIAAAAASRHAARLTREALCGVYRAFCEYVGPEALTPETVRAYRQRQWRAGQVRIGTERVQPQAGIA